MLKICALAVICAAVAIIIKQTKSEISFLIKMAGGIVIFATLIISAEPLILYLRDLSNIGRTAEYIEIMLKALGIGLIAHICSNICKSCGESELAVGVELAGKVEILLICVPLIEKILGYASEIISMQG